MQAYYAFGAVAPTFGALYQEGSIRLGLALSGLSQRLDLGYTVREGGLALTPYLALRRRTSPEEVRAGGGLRAKLEDRVFSLSGRLEYLGEPVFRLGVRPAPRRLGASKERWPTRAGFGKEAWREGPPSRRRWGPTSPYGQARAWAEGSASPSAPSPFPSVCRRAWVTKVGSRPMGGSGYAWTAWRWGAAWPTNPKGLPPPFT